MSSFWCSKNEIIEYGGISKEAFKWANDKNLPWDTVKKRVQRGASWRSALELSDDDIKPFQYSLFEKKRTYKKNKAFVNGYYAR